jgi:hypothetical protein
VRGVFLKMWQVGFRFAEMASWQVGGGNSGGRMGEDFSTYLS